MVAGVVSSCLAPWFEIQMPSTPCLTASEASSAVITPFTTIYTYRYFYVEEGRGGDPENTEKRAKRQQQQQQPTSQFTKVVSRVSSPFSGAKGAG